MYPITELELRKCSLKRMGSGRFEPRIGRRLLVVMAPPRLLLGEMVDEIGLLSDVCEG